VQFAQLLNLAELSRDLGVALNTAKAWLAVLEATFQVIILRPYFADVGKRLVKSPKVYFSDVGTLCHLTGLKDPEHAATGAKSPRCTFGAPQPAPRRILWWQKADG
jgi:predicted AAA+ superfamily ATPase